MSQHLTFSMIMAVTALGLTAPLSAQGRTTVSGAELDAAVAARPTGNRQAIRTFLMTDHAQKVAGRMGVSTSELSARVAALDQASVDRLAQRTDADDRPLAGGANTIVVSTTTIIIALLLIILLTD